MDAFLLSVLKNLPLLALWRIKVGQCKIPIDLTSLGSAGIVHQWSPNTAKNALSKNTCIQAGLMNSEGVKFCPKVSGCYDPMGQKQSIHVAWNLPSKDYTTQANGWKTWAMQNDYFFHLKSPSPIFSRRGVRRAWKTEVFVTASASNLRLMDWREMTDSLNADSPL